MNNVVKQKSIEDVLTLPFEIHDPKEKLDYEAAATKLRWLEYQTIGKQNRVIALAVMRANAYAGLHSWRLNMLAQTRLYYSDAPDVAFKEIEDHQKRYFIQCPEDCDSKDHKYLLLKQVVCAEDNTRAIVMLVRFIVRTYGWYSVSQFFH